MGCEMMQWSFTLFPFGWMISYFSAIDNAEVMRYGLLLPECGNYEKVRVSDWTRGRQAGAALSESAFLIRWIYHDQLID